MRIIKRKNFNDVIKGKYIASIIFNVLIILMVIAGLAWGLVTPDPFGLDKSNFFRYFTTLSNLLMGCVAVIFLIYEFLFFFNRIEKIPLWVCTLKLIGTVGVTVTFFTVILFLAPVSNWNPMLFSDSCLFYHLLVPIFAIITYIVFEHNDMHLAYSATGIIPVFVYGIVYCSIALTHINPQTGTTIDWKVYDWYQFVEQVGVKWVWAVIIVMLGLTYLFSWLLWLSNRKIHIGEKAIMKGKHTNAI